MSFAINISKNIDKNISKNLSGKYRLKLLDHAKQSATDALQNAAQATSDLSGNKIASRIMKVSRTSPQNNSETITNEHDKEIL